MQFFDKQNFLRKWEEPEIPALPMNDCLAKIIQKTRPAIVISNDSFNKNLSRVIVAPITSRVKSIYQFDCISINSLANLR